MQQQPNAARRESAPRVVRIGQWYAAADDPAVAAAIRLLESAEEPTSPLMELTDDMLLKVARLLLDDNLPAVFSLSRACRQLHERLQPVCVEARARRLRWAMAGVVFPTWHAGCYINNRICTAQGTIDTVGGYAVGPVIPPGRRVEFTVTFVGGEYRRSSDEDLVRRRLRRCQFQLSWWAWSFRRYRGREQSVSHRPRPCHGQTDCWVWASHLCCRQPPYNAAVGLTYPPHRETSTDDRCHR